MRRVIVVSLNGNAFQLEDDAHAALSAYLEAAERALAGNPDRSEIIADLEQAIADKSGRYLSSHKSVLARLELEQILTEMGPVDGATAAEPQADASTTGAAAATGPAGPAPRRLYQISEGAKISGVCMGLAAYFGLDVTLVRLLFVAAAFMTGGGAFIAYLVLMFVVPYAQTSEEHAAAHGLPFNARALVERAKQQAALFANSSEWRRSRAAWRASWRRGRDKHQAARGVAGTTPPPASPPPAAAAPSRPPYAAHIITGIVLAVLGLFLALFTFVWVIALVSLAATGAILGWILPLQVPFWIAVLALVLLYNLVAWPIKAVRHAVYRPGGGYHPTWVGAWDGVAVLALVLVLGWWAYHHLANVHDFLEPLLHGARATLSV